MVGVTSSQMVSSFYSNVDLATGVTTGRHFYVETDKTVLESFGTPIGLWNALRGLRGPPGATRSI